MIIPSSIVRSTRNPVPTEYFGHGTKVCSLELFCALKLKSFIFVPDQGEKQETQGFDSFLVFSRKVKWIIESYPH